MKVSVVQRKVLQHLKDGARLTVIRGLATIVRRTRSKYGLPADIPVSIATVSALDRKRLIEGHGGPGPQTSYFLLTESGKAALED